MNSIEQPLLIKKYLLGDLDDQEREAFEDRFFGDDALFEEVVAAETDLIDSYVRGEIAGPERKKFEEQFLKSPERRERVETASVLMEHLSEMSSKAAASVSPAQPFQESYSWWRGILAFLNVTYAMPRAAFAVVALAFILFGSWVLVKNRQLAREVAQMRSSQLETQRQLGGVGQGAREAASQQESSGSGNKQENTPRKTVGSHTSHVEIAEARPPSPPVSLLLKPGIFRGIEGETRSLNLGGGGQTSLIIRPGVSKVQLQLEFDRSDYSLYSVTLQTDDQSETWQKRALTSERTRDGHWIVRLNAPADLFKTGDYVVELKGTAAGESDQDVEDYSFRVQKQ